jgi:hypothetical protein
MARRCRARVRIANPYKGIRYQNQCYLRFLADSGHASKEPITALWRRWPDLEGYYCPWSFSTLSQAALIWGRFC